jgi:hypothetical protein
MGPTLGKTLWLGFGGGCETNNDGDPTVHYDEAADRWVLTQFSVTTTPYLQCVAVSVTADATGQYYRYAFTQPNFNDYAKMSVWPDAYYFTYNMFSGNTFLGARACAVDRSKMLAGAAAVQVCFQQDASVASLLPSDLDGSTPPPAGAPNFLLSAGTSSLNLFKFHVDFVTPSNSTFTGPTAIPVAASSPACGGGVCIPQLGTTQQLDSLGGFLMYRLPYRNFGDHEALVANESVVAGNRVGVRWYEVRNPGSTPALYQQGTFAPDSSYRWMGSIGMDHVGNIALGYSVSSSSMHPSIAFTGRAPTDPLNNLRAESTIQTGGGSQTGALDRWGDYSSMAIDPVDDCTFWYTNQYLRSSGSFNWSTRIANFKFDSCTPDFSIAASQPSQTVAQGDAISYSVTITPSGGFNSGVSLSVDGLPSGASASFNPSSITGSGNSTLTMTTTPTTHAGIYLLTITGTSGSLNHTAQVTLVVGVKATMLTPVPGSTLSGGSVQFTWTSGTSVTQYSLWIGTTPGGYDVGNVIVTASSYTATVPGSGATLYVRLWSLMGGVWQYIDYTYTEASFQAAMISPAPGSTLPGAAVTFTWTAGTGVTQYSLWFGSTPGGTDVGNVIVAGTSYAATVPGKGTTLYVRLWSLIGGAWQYIDYTYTEASFLAAMTGPVPGSTLPGTAIAFTWTAGTGVTQYSLWLGSTLGGHDLGNVLVDVTSYMVNLPATSTTLYVRLWSLVGGVWQFIDYTYVH